MNTFTFTTGASSAELFGLANANFETMTISAGAGDYTLDFSGSLSRDATVDIKAGVSNIKIIIPASMNARINNLGIVTNINTRGTWLLSDNTYTTEAEGPMLTINLNVSVGNVSLIRE
jgi:predicted membrane protein